MKVSELGPTPSRSTQKLNHFRVVDENFDWTLPIGHLPRSDRLCDSTYSERTKMFSNLENEKKEDGFVRMAWNASEFCFVGGLRERKEYQKRVETVSWVNSLYWRLILFCYWNINWPVESTAHLFFQCPKLRWLAKNQGKFKRRFYTAMIVLLVSYNT